MSDKLHLSFVDDEIEIHVNRCSIRVTELRVEPASNWVTPHRVLGKGKASLMLTDMQFAQLLAAWCSHVLCRNQESTLDYELKGRGFNFQLSVDRVESEANGRTDKRAKKTAPVKGV